MFPLSPEEDRQRLPVAVISGFLGSGKTTLLNRLLQDPRLADTAVAINEFGAIPLDQHLIDHGADKTVVMANGCLCCNVAGDMEEAVMRIFSRRESGATPYFARLLVEPSGLADPAPIAQAVLRQPTLSRVMRLDGIVTVIDALFGPVHLRDHPEARQQARLADRVVVTKGDLADPAPVRDALRTLGAAAPVLDAPHGRVDAGALFSASFLDPTAPLSPVAEWVERDAPHLHSAATALCLVADRPLDWPGVDRWLRGVRIGHGDALLRVKGLLAVAGRARPVVIQGVHHVLHPPAELAGWPGADRRSRLVLILRDPALAATLQQDWDRALPSLTDRVPA